MNIRLCHKEEIFFIIHRFTNEDITNRKFRDFGTFVEEKKKKSLSSLEHEIDENIFVSWMIIFSSTSE